MNRHRVSLGPRASRRALCFSKGRARLEARGPKVRAVLRCFVLAIALLLSSLPVHAAITPDEILPDPALEARAREITKQLRCLVCQNQSIDDSNAPLAHDLRVLVRERLKAGDSDEAALAFVVARYGDFVLLRPPVKATTWLLWFGPGALLIGAALFLWVRARRRSALPAAPAPLSDDERKKLAALLDGAPREAGR